MQANGVVVVTGASQGVGLATAQLFAAFGFEVHAQYRTSPGEIPMGNVHWWQADFTDPAALETNLPSLERLDALIHCAGVCELGSMAEVTREQLLGHYEVNVVAPALVTAHFLPALRAANGIVVVVNSGAGQHTHANWGAYSASKFAARAWADALRQEEPEIRVTSIYPGRIATNMQRSIRAQEGKEFEPEKYLRPDTVASQILNVVAAPGDASLDEIILRPNG